MPFTTPFKSTYDTGDLVYGLGGPRKSLMTDVFKLSGPNIRTVDLSTINNYSTTKPEKDTMESRLQYARGYDDTMVKDHRAEVTKFNTALKAHGKYAGAVDWEQGSLTGASRDQAENAAWRKKCKGGLYYACFVAKTHVHFCLEEMNFEQIVKKTYADADKGITEFKQADGAKFRAITNAELRWIYRNKDHDEVKSRVQFWKKENDAWVACVPPWVGDGASLWEQYKPSRKHNVHGRTDD